jgi:hypothetical protein
MGTTDTEAHGAVETRWSTIRYAIDSNARTVRLCAILIAMSLLPVGVSVAIYCGWL